MKKTMLFLVLCVAALIGNAQVYGSGSQLFGDGLTQISVHAGGFLGAVTPGVTARMSGDYMEPRLDDVSTTAGLGTCYGVAIARESREEDRFGLGLRLSLSWATQPFEGSFMHGTTSHQFTISARQLQTHFSIFANYNKGENLVFDLGPVLQFTNALGGTGTFDTLSNAFDFPSQDDLAFRLRWGVEASAKYFVTNSIFVGIDLQVTPWTFDIVDMRDHSEESTDLQPHVQCNLDPNGIGKADFGDVFNKCQLMLVAGIAL